MVSLRMHLVLFEVQAALFSGGACAWLLVKLHSDAAGFRNRLFPTQLRYLAFADLCFVLCTLPVVPDRMERAGFLGRGVGRSVQVEQDLADVLEAREPLDRSAPRRELRLPVHENAVSEIYVRCPPRRVCPPVPHSGQCFCVPLGL